MGAPCAIGKKMEDGSVKAIRCNYDGYVAGAGAILGGWYAWEEASDDGSPKAPYAQIYITE